ncbi:MAG: protein kinase [Cyanobacteria bacterium P01_D01_bin.36]
MEIWHKFYEIKKKLGDRHNCKTFLARDRHNQTFVVINQLLCHSELDPLTVGRLELEANKLKAVEHPAIPRYLSSFQVSADIGKGFALVQRFVAADSLAQQVANGRHFTESDLKHIARYMLGVLTYLHTSQPAIIHHDINPSNILLSSCEENPAKENAIKEAPAISAAAITQQIFLVGFGSVQAIHPEVHSRTVLGTHGYTSPEQFDARAVPASDLYGLGATLIYLASGRQPIEFLQKDLALQFESSVSLSPAFIQWLRVMTAPKLSKRFSSAQQALRALNTGRIMILSRRPQTALPVIKPEKTRVSINKSSDQMEIVVPPQGWTLWLIYTIVFGVVARIGVADGV